MLVFCYLPRCAIFLRLTIRDENQRALNGGLDPWGVGSANLGRPIFASNLPENACFKGIWGKFEAKMGRPKFADPTPHGSNPPLTTL